MGLGSARAQDARAGAVASGPRRRRLGGDRGLTTLEWLLIVAAVAGIAALAVVLVQNVVSDTSEQIAGNNARKVAAQLAGEEIAADAKRLKDSQPVNLVTWDDWIRYYDLRCKRLRITYGDAGIHVAPNFTVPPHAVRQRITDADLARINQSGESYRASCLVS